ncbi:MAG: histidine--tRNA ligase, partial [Spirochaetaceae bacterium]|nr:histidine--tRNA ligase [Spirochaetaceae bacterium]
EVLVLNLEEGFGPRYHAAAAALRAAGLAAEVFPDRKKLAQQFSYAEKKGVPLALIQGGAEAERGVIVVKDLGNRESLEAKTLEEAVRLAKERLGR